MKKLTQSYIGPPQPGSKGNLKMQTLLGFGMRCRSAPLVILQFYLVIAVTLWDTCAKHALCAFEHGRSGSV